MRRIGAPVSVSHMCALSKVRGQGGDDGCLGGAPKPFQSLLFDAPPDPPESVLAAAEEAGKKLSKKERERRLKSLARHKLESVFARW